ncbi:MAG TPA: neutral/alkaline non-lysosomal ceramidase N-terminal domain-containing protein [Methylomirabilota bacterium]
MTRGAALAVLLLFVLGVAAAAAQPCPDCFRAGAAAGVFAVPPGTPLAGYGGFTRRLLVPDVLGLYRHAFWFKPSEGELDPVGVRALVMEGGGGRIVWVAADLIAVDRAFTATLRRRLLEAGVPAAALIVSASHTHSGPGAFLHGALIGALALDRYDDAVGAAILDAMVSTVRAAEIAKAPARVGSATGTVTTLTVPRLASPPDPEVVVLRVDTAAGAPLALVWNFAIHGTTLGPRNRRLSADVMGVASRRLERTLGVPALFVNGAVGDVSPARHGEEGAGELGTALAATVHSVWERARTRATAAVAARTRTVELPSPSLPVRNCLGRWIPSSLTLPLASAVPADAELTAAAVGDLAWVTMPGELQSSLGARVKEGVRRRGRRAFVAGLSNDYLGYFVARGDYDHAAYVTCVSLFGADGGERLAGAAAVLLRALETP